MENSKLGWWMGKVTCRENHLVYSAVVLRLCIIYGHGVQPVEDIVS